MADALASGASVLRDVGVQVPLRPPGAVPRTASTKVTNSKEVVTFVFGAFGLPAVVVAALGGTWTAKSPGGLACVSVFGSEWALKT